VVAKEEKNGQWRPIKAIYDAGHYDTEELSEQEIKERGNKVKLQVKSGTHGFTETIDEESQPAKFKKEHFKKLDAKILQTWDKRVVRLLAWGRHRLGLWDAFLFPWTVGEGEGRIDSFTSEITAAVILSVKKEQAQPLVTPVEQLLRSYGVYDFAFDIILTLIKNGRFPQEHITGIKDQEGNIKSHILEAIKTFGLGVNTRTGDVSARALTLAVGETGDYPNVHEAFLAIDSDGTIFVRPGHQEDGIFVFKGLVIEEGAQLKHHITITDAIKGSSSGDTIYVGPGLYQENLEITKNVRLKGSGGHYYHGVWVPNVSLVPKDPEQAQIVAIENAEVTLEEFSVGHGRSYGVWIWIGEFAHVTLRRNRFISNEQDGIVIEIEEDAHVTIRENHIFGNYNGIFAQAFSGRIELFSNWIFGNKHDGISLGGSVGGSAVVVIQNNKIENNKGCGVRIRSPGITTQPPLDQLGQQNTIANNDEGNICEK